VGFGNFSGSPQDAQLSSNGAFLIGETGLQWQSAAIFERDGNLKLGAWGHNFSYDCSSSASVPTIKLVLPAMDGWVNTG